MPQQEARKLETTKGERVNRDAVAVWAVSTVRDFLSLAKGQLLNSAKLPPLTPPEFSTIA